ncbi:MAG: tetratricopeptide repeat protein [Archangiaceae bacterium]|nr:tetratricopeptide repeat protein [Archangiaceae bacterium]
MSACFDEDRVLALLERRLPDTERAEVEAHLDRCEGCRTWVAQVARDWFPAAAAPSHPGPARPEPEGALELRRGMLLGRYLLLETLGAGGMGMVFEAYDPELDRKIAIKLLRPEPRGPSGAQQHLLAEAKAIARLQHPHVVAVYDVGTIEGRVFVALELVVGQTLGQWLAGAARPWREVLRLFLQAGEGLAAAHAVGIVHRDFKPSNVLVGGDGRARVCDFGLAHEASVGQGTPAYMAPERRAGASGDARADQFSYCVALREALQRHPGAPRRVLKALERGLSPEPSARWPSMSALLHALKPPRRTGALWAAAVVTAALAALIAVPRVLATQRAARCAAPPTDSSVGFGAERAAAARAAFERTGLAFAADAWARVEPRLTAYAAALSTEQRAACEATWVSGRLPEPVLRSRLSCLERDRRQLAVLAELFSAADRELVGKAVEAVGALPDPSLCAQVVEPDPPGTHQVRQQLAEATALGSAARHQQAEPIAAAALEAARALHSRALEAEAELVEARALDRLAKLDAAEAGYGRAVRAAQAAHADEVGAKAATALVFLRGVKRHQVEAGREAARDASAWVERLGNPPDRVAALLQGEAAIARLDGKYADAAALDRRSAELRERLLPPDPLALADSYVWLTTDLRLEGRYPEALVEARRALELHQRVLGKDHPGAASSVSNVAMLLSMTGKAEEAIAYHRHALELRTRAFPKGHPEIASSQLNVGQALAIAGRYDEALPLLLDAAQTAHAAGADPFAATAHVNAAAVLTQLGRPVEAEAEAREALAIRTRLFAPGHPDLGYAHATLGSALLAQHRAAAALAELQAGLSLWEKSFGPEYPDLGDLLVDLGRAQLELGAPAKAVPLLERALALLPKTPDSEYRPVEAGFFLSQALWEAGLDRARAVSLAKAALASESPRREDARRWLALHATTAAAPR